MSTYKLLSQQERDDGSEDEYVLESSDGRKAGIPWKDILSLALCFITCLTTATAGITLYRTLSRPASLSLVRPEPRVLRRVSPYVNPDRLADVIRQHNASFAPFANVGPAAFQMAAADAQATRALREDASRMESTEFGMIWPEDRHFVVTHETSTVYQFRNRDFGMENCVIHAEIPEPSRVLDPALNISASDVNVWMLVDAPELRPSISWGRAPPRDRLFATVSFNGTTRFASRPFRCPSGRFTTLEFACRSSEAPCQVEFWQDLSNPPKGIYIMQHQSI